MQKVSGRNGGTLEARQKGDPALPGAGRPPKSDILMEVGEMMEGDGYAEIEGDLLGEDGKPIYREDGKVMKGPNYFKPDFSKILKIVADSK